MVYKADKLRLRKLLMDAISLLCKNGLPVQSAFRIEATIGITLSEDEVVLVSFREVVQPDGAMAPQALSEDEASDEASSILSQGDDLDGEDRKKAGDEAASNRPSQAVDIETRDEMEDESGAWSETGESAFVGNPGVVGNFDLKRRSSAGGDNLNCPQLDANVFSYDESSRVRPGCSSINRINHNNTSSLDHGNHRSRSNVQIKDEVIDDEDCTFVKMEDGGGAGVFDPLVPDEGWMYQVYNETNLYSAVGSELSQLTQGQDYDETPSGLMPASNQSWTASPRDTVRSAQPHRGGSGTPRGGGVPRSGVRQSLPVASRNQVMVMGLCQRIINESTLESSGRYLCHICQARLGNIQTLRNHIKKTHLALKIERCRTCGAAFRWASQLARHKKREHGLLGAPLSAEGQGGSASRGMEAGYGETLEAPYGGVDEGQRYSE